MAGKSKKITIKIKREDLPSKPRMGVQPTKKIESRKKYSRKPKHKKKEV